ncbi:hypothetical protein [Furfurilactobacillus cerevisiae]|uniref:hypothetical protein n=1 Tax=Furfurilactobacillus rossiae TaxID=231049 RepID=UPI003B97DF14
MLATVFGLAEHWKTTRYQVRHFIHLFVDSETIKTRKVNKYFFAIQPLKYVKQDESETNSN